MLHDKHEYITEHNPNELEQAPEHIPSAEEVGELFAQLLLGEAYTETKRLEDERGLYRLDVTLEGGGAEYSYMRKSDHPGAGWSADTVINVILYNKDGMPISGSSVAKCDNGNWTLTP